MKIVDEFTGRIMEGRRWSEGLHQAIEAKEGVRIQEENQYARHDHAAELLPPLREARRHDRHGEDGGEGVRRDLRPPRRRDPDERPGRPRRRERLHLQDEGREVRGRRSTTSTSGTRRASRCSSARSRSRPPSTSSELLKRRGDPAQRPEREGARARGRDHHRRRPARRRHDRDQHGRPRRRHQARRRRRRRSAGSTCSRPSATSRGASTTSCAAAPAARATRARRASTSPAQDDLVRLFAGDRIHGIMERFKLPDDQPMEAEILSRQIEGAQKKVEEQNFVARKNVLKYDDVMNTQRMVIYEQRRRVLDGEDLSEDIARLDRRRSSRTNVVERTPRPTSSRTGISTRLVAADAGLYGTDITVEELREEVELDREALTEEFVEDALDDVRREGGGARTGADARARALRDPAGRRHALARAPRRRWTTCARASTCARWRRRIRSSSTAPRAT